MTAGHPGSGSAGTCGDRYKLPDPDPHPWRPTRADYGQRPTCDCGEERHHPNHERREAR